jgi:hypothetical protein
MTRAVVPLMFEVNCAAVVTTMGVAFPPPVVPLPFVAQPIRVLGAGGVVQPPPVQAPD